MKTDWAQEFTSCKFWMAVAAFAIGMPALFGLDINTVQQISSMVMSLGAVIAYIAGKDSVGAAAAGENKTEQK